MTNKQPAKECIQSVYTSRISTFYTDTEACSSTEQHSGINEINNLTASKNAHMQFAHKQALNRTLEFHRSEPLSFTGQHGDKKITTWHCCDY